MSPVVYPTTETKWMTYFSSPVRDQTNESLLSRLLFLLKLQQRRVSVGIRLCFVWALSLMRWQPSTVRALASLDMWNKRWHFICPSHKTALWCFQLSVICMKLHWWQTERCVSFICNCVSHYVHTFIFKKKTIPDKLVITTNTFQYFILFDMASSVDREIFNILQRRTWTCLVRDLSVKITIIVIKGWVNCDFMGITTGQRWHR